MFTESAVALAQEVWTWVADARPELESRLMVEVAEAWSSTVLDRRGLFSSAHKSVVIFYIYVLMLTFAFSAARTLSTRRLSTPPPTRRR